MAVLNFARFTATSGSMEALEGAKALASGLAIPRLLLLHGPTGVGKSHLLHAVLDLVRALDQPARVAYTSATDFVQDLISDLARGQLLALPRDYALADVVAIDDLHVLARKSRTQREVGILLTAAVNSGTRVICAAGCRLEELVELFATLSDVPTARLVELRPPGDAEMRRIVVTLAEEQGILLDAQAVASIEARSRGDVRVAMGALARRHFVERRSGKALGPF